MDLLFSRYTVIKTLRESGEHTWLLAEDTVRAQRVMLKVLDVTRVRDAEALDRMRAEHRLLSGTQNEALLRAHDLLQDEKSIVLVTDPPDGDTIEDLVRDKRRFTGEHAQFLLANALSSLAKMHALSPRMIH